MFPRLIYCQMQAIEAAEIVVEEIGGEEVRVAGKDYRVLVEGETAGMPLGAYRFRDDGGRSILRMAIQARDQQPEQQQGAKMVGHATNIGQNAELKLSVG